ncbi:class I SAM-dependent methyltransferase [Lusitaniella coriacea]|uniref:class I SAM-dependent methyltransferase n=1 Tax=Lusitaniella coriacea TaxID=1983105 RepID=UPI003CF050DB
MVSSLNNPTLHHLIRDRVLESPQQRITFADYMNLALYHPQKGYYSGGNVGIGSQGDFFTASSLGSDFGELLAEQFAQTWEILGRPNTFTLVEMGAGQGQCAGDIIRHLQTHYLELCEVAEYIIIEQSPALIERQKAHLQQWLEAGINLQWKTWSEIEAESIVGCCFSNELIDAFPVHQVIKKDGELQEIYVTISDEKFTETIDELSTPKLKEYFEKIDIDILSPTYPNEYRTEVNLAALKWLETIANKLKQGYLLTIDYGYPAHRYYNPRRDRGTLQCYYQHRRHNNPYVNLGQQDITAHVDFTALERQGEQYGLNNIGSTQQAIFLMALGLGNRLAELSGGELNIQQTLKRRDALHQLIDPNGLGGFNVLVQSKGLNESQLQQDLKGLAFPA